MGRRATAPSCVVAHLPPQWRITFHVGRLSRRVNQVQSVRDDAEKPVLLQGRRHGWGVATGAFALFGLVILVAGLTNLQERLLLVGVGGGFLLVFAFLYRLIARRAVLLGDEIAVHGVFGVRRAKVHDIAHMAIAGTGHVVVLLWLRDGTRIGLPVIPGAEADLWKSFQRRHGLAPPNQGGTYAPMRPLMVVALAGQAALGVGGIIWFAAVPAVRTLIFPGAVLLACLVPLGAVAVEAWLMRRRDDRGIRITSKEVALRSRHGFVIPRDGLEIVSLRGQPPADDASYAADRILAHGRGRTTEARPSGLYLTLRDVEGRHHTLDLSLYHIDAALDIAIQLGVPENALDIVTRPTPDGPNGHRPGRR